MKKFIGPAPGEIMCWSITVDALALASAVESTYGSNIVALGLPRPAGLARHECSPTLVRGGRSLSLGGRRLGHIVSVVQLRWVRHTGRRRYWDGSFRRGLVTWSSGRIGVQSKTDSPQMLAGCRVEVETGSGGTSLSGRGLPTVLV